MWSSLPSNVCTSYASLDHCVRVAFSTELYFSYPLISVYVVTLGLSRADRGSIGARVEALSSYSSSSVASVAIDILQLKIYSVVHEMQWQQMSRFQS